MSGAATEEGGGDTARRCGARLRTGGSCPLPPAAGKHRCFQHGGARGSGAPAGNRNNWRDGFYSREMKAERRRINGFIRECLQTLRKFGGR
ncbi:MAG TPA: HGGxSTG domain-containing protein [Candidatus Angelobacter sp.]|nr:HGGxSTG domain-containing protein [Candidatus Angelobacter sp.]